MTNEQRYRMAVQLLNETIALIKEDYSTNDLEDYITSLENGIKRESEKEDLVEHA